MLKIVYRSSVLSTFQHKVTPLNLHPIIREKQKSYLKDFKLWDNRYVDCANRLQLCISQTKRNFIVGNTLCKQMSE